MLKKKKIQAFKQQIHAWNSNNNYTEKSIEFAYYNLIDKYYNTKYKNKDLIRIEYNSPYSSDGIITIERNKIDYSILIEAKYDKDYTNKKDLITVLCQAIYYLKRLENEQELLPAVILLVSKNNTAIIRTEEVTNYLFNDYDWDQPANQAFTNVKLYDSLYDNNDLQPFIYDLFTDSINDYLERIDDYCNNSLFVERKNRNYKITNQLLILDEYSDHSLVKKFDNLTDNNYFYNTIDNKWYEYNGKYWSNINSAIIKQRIFSFLSDLNIEINNKNNSIYYFRLSQKLTSVTTLDNIYELFYIIKSKNIPHNTNIISLNNGDYNIKNSEFLKHSKEHYSFNYYDYDYNGNNYALFNLIGNSNLANNDLMLGWFNECITTDKNSMVLILDLLDSFNYWLINRGHSKVSIRYFSEALKNHRVIRDTNATFKKNSVMYKEYNHSQWFDPDNRTKMPRELGVRPTFYVGLKFK